MRIERVTDPDHHFINALGDGLSEHAARSTGAGGFHGIGVRALDDNGDFIGGIQAWVNWNWLQIYLVWVDDQWRGTGVGSRMLAEIENIGRERGCEYAHLDTFSFQAPGFYRKFGYKEFASLDDYPDGHSRRFLRKFLRD